MIEETILSNLILNDDYFRRVSPYIKDEYFGDPTHQKIVQCIQEYVEKYSKPPSKEALIVAISDRKDLNEEGFRQAKEQVDNLQTDSKTDQDWLIDATESFCQQQDLFNSIRRSILIIDGKDKELDKGGIPKLITDSLGISFNTHVGHDYMEDVESRYEFYHRKQERMELDIELLNTVTKGGLPRKSLTVLLGTTGSGKSLAKCHMAAQQLLYGRNVLYITMELAEEVVAQRIDANILDLTVDEVTTIPLGTFERRMARVKEKTPGKLIIKEYPNGSAHAGHFRHLLNELRLKKQFVPDIIFLDYLNICASSRIKGAAAANSYTLIKAIAEEIRGLAMEFNVAIVSSSQYNRAGYDNTDVDLTNVSDSIGLAYTADAIFALISSEELEQMGQLLIKQLKNRWGSLSDHTRFVVGIDRSKMKLYNLETSAQYSVASEPIMDRSKTAGTDSKEDQIDFEKWESSKQRRKRR
jgi:replicative DNA helicase